MSISPTVEAPDPVITSTRVFDAPPDVLFHAFSDPDALARWWGPAGFTNTFEEFDLRPGGSWRFTMHAPDGADIPMVKRFIEVVPAKRIVVEHDQGTHTFRTAMLYSEEATGTRLTWHMHFVAAEEAERVRVVVQQANEQNFDRLEALLAAAQGL